MTSLADAIAQGEDHQDDWEVYGDWLESQGDPRGELIRLCIARASADSPDQREAHEGRMAELEASLNAPLVQLAGESELGWRYGFVESLRAVEPWQQDLATARERLAALFDSPALAFLRTLEIDREDRTDVAMNQLGQRGIFEWAAPVLEAHSLAGLRRLRIGADPTEGMHVSQTSAWMITSNAPGTPGAQIRRPDRYVGDLSPALERMPNLRELRVTGEGIRIERLPARLTSLRLETRFLRRSTVEAVAAAKLPELRSLELWLGYWPDSVVEFEGPEGEEFYGPSVGAEHLRGLFEGDGFPALRHLALSNCQYMPEVLEALARSRILAQLETLDLSYGFLSGDDWRPLFEHADRFRHLARIDLSHHELGPREVAVLQEMFGAAIDLFGQMGSEGNAAIRLLSY